MHLGVVRVCQGLRSPHLAVLATVTAEVRVGDAEGEQCSLELDGILQLFVYYAAGLEVTATDVALSKIHTAQVSSMSLNTLQRSTLEHCFLRVSPCEICGFECGPMAICARQVCFNERCTPCICLRHVDVGKASPIEDRVESCCSPQEDLPKIRVREHRFVEFRSLHICAGQVGTLKLCTLHLGVCEIGAYGLTSGEMCLLQVAF
mmetsp:Transcript_4020/g.7768  ORF Transcript_4020/g.7768 Transcript_4020/m.7768 type:complete len:205 (-) Transcript_4020:9-623(-)